MNSTLNIVQYRDNPTITINRQHRIQYCFARYVLKKYTVSASDKEIIKFVFYNKTLLLTLRCHQETHSVLPPLPSLPSPLSLKLFSFCNQFSFSVLTSNV